MEALSFFLLVAPIDDFLLELLTFLFGDAVEVPREELRLLCVGVPGTLDTAELGLVVLLLEYPLLGLSPASAMEIMRCRLKERVLGTRVFLGIWSVAAAGASLACAWLENECMVEEWGTVD